MNRVTHLTITHTTHAPRSLTERIDAAVTPLLAVALNNLEKGKHHQNLAFLSSEFEAVHCVGGWARL